MRNPSHAFTPQPISFTHMPTPTPVHFLHTSACHYITPPPLVHSTHTSASPLTLEQ